MSPIFEKLRHPKARAREAAEQRYGEMVAVTREFLDGFDPRQRGTAGPDMVRLRAALEQIHERDDLAVWGRATFLVGACGALAVSPACNTLTWPDPSLALTDWRITQGASGDWLALAATAVTRHPAADSEVARDLGRPLAPSVGTAPGTPDPTDPAQAFRRVAAFWTAVFGAPLPDALRPGRLAAPLDPAAALAEVRQRHDDIAMTVCVAVEDNARVAELAATLLPTGVFDEAGFRELTVDYVAGLVGVVLGEYAGLADGPVSERAFAAACDAARRLAEDRHPAEYQAYVANDSVLPSFRRYVADRGLANARELVDVGTEAFTAALVEA